MSKTLNSWLEPILTTAPVVQQQLIAATLADELRAKAFGITPANVESVLQQRSLLLRAVYPAYVNFCQDILQLEPSQRLATLWDLWLPLAVQLASYRKHLDRPLIQGVLGGQGTGKTTLAAMLSLILPHLGYRSLSLSLDDIYKTYSDRLALTAQDPRLEWRGPPGTHDLELGLAVLKQLRQSHPDQLISVPRFDKSAYAGAGDRSQPEVVKNADIVLFEGWFVGVRPIDSASFNIAPPPIITPADQQFARDTNTRLQNYVPLWEQLDRLIVLHPVDYRFSLEWRQQAERQMLATGKSGMTSAQIEQFVKYFWRSLHPDLFIKPLIKDPNRVDLVIEINSDHSPGAVYHPADAV